MSETASETTTVLIVQNTIDIWLWSTAWRRLKASSSARACLVRQIRRRESTNTVQCVIVTTQHVQPLCGISTPRMPADHAESDIADCSNAPLPTPPPPPPPFFSLPDPSCVYTFAGISKHSSFRISDIRLSLGCYTYWIETFAALTRIQRSN